MSKLLSGRVRKTPNNQVPADRYQFLSLKDVEPNLGNPTGPKDALLASKPDGTPRKLLDVSRARAMGWKPTIELAAGIKNAYADFIFRFGDI